MPHVEIEPISYSQSRFWLEAATDPDDSTTVDLLFSNEELARKAAFDLIKEFEWIQISEWGEWHLKNGKTKKSWVAFWWTDACGYRGSPAEKSGDIGVPEGQHRIRHYIAAQRPDNE